MKPYESYKKTNIPWLDEVPSHWDVKRGKHIFENKKQLNRDNDCTEVLSLTLNGVIDNNGEKPIGLSPKDYATYQLFNKNDLVFKLIDLENLKTSRVGLVHKKGIMSSAYIRLVKRKDNNSRYFYFQYYDLYLRAVFNGLGAGVRSTMSASDLTEINIVIPPRTEQDQIVRYLDWQISKINKLVQTKKRQIELLKEQKQAVINKAVTKGLDDSVPMKDSGVEWLGEVPEHWERCRLKQVVDVINDKTSENTMKYIGMENIKSWTGEYIQTEEIQPEGVSNKYYDNCILFGKLRPYLAKVLITRDCGICSGELLVLRPVSINIVLLKFILLSPIVIDIINSSTYGAKMPRANWNFIGNVEIPLPPLEEQQAIVDYITDITGKIDTVIKETEREIELLSEYKTSLISSVVTGKVDVRDVAVPKFETVEDVTEDVEDDEEKMEG